MIYSMKSTGNARFVCISFKVRLAVNQYSDEGKGEHTSGNYEQMGGCWLYSLPGSGKKGLSFFTTRLQYAKF